ncbi:MAG: hypothetical protein KC503_21920 [Myxococcales bacterium]|nr:hypothetical protein [Myxococcales bacterium]
MTLIVENNVPGERIALGLVVVENVIVGRGDLSLDDEIAALVERRAEALDDGEDAIRRACRDMLRNGRYKPTGRGKPASEYLLREASRGEFPRVLDPVDALNLVSLAHLVPISLWDLDKAAVAAGREPAAGSIYDGDERFEVRLGRSGERYVFNSADQLLELEDLVVGCALTAGGESVPLWTPIKDGMRSKIDASTRRVAACIYYPIEAGERAHLETITAELHRWLDACRPDGGGAARAAHALAMPHETATL